MPGRRASTSDWLMQQRQRGSAKRPMRAKRQLFKAPALKRAAVNVAPVYKSKQSLVWGISPQLTTNYSICNPLNLTSGIVVLPEYGLTINLSDSDNSAVATYTPKCIYGTPVTYIGASNPWDISSILVAQTGSWQDWLDGDGGYNLSAFPLAYGVAASTVVCLMCLIVTLGVDAGFRGKWPLAQKLSLIVAPVYLIVTWGLSYHELGHQSQRGYFDSYELREYLYDCMALKVLFLVFNSILLITKVQLTMDLFPRRNERRLILWIGLALTVTFQSLWGVSQFSESANADVLPALVYLFQICIDVFFLLGVACYAFMKGASIVLQRNLFLLTIMTHLAAFSPLLMFIVDIVGLWNADWSDSLNWMTSILAMVAVRYWYVLCERACRKRDKDRILGKQVFDYEMFGFGFDGNNADQPSASQDAKKKTAPSSRSNSDSASISSDSVQNPRIHHGRVVDLSASPSSAQAADVALLYPFWLAHKAVISVTDWIIETGFSFSRNQTPSQSPPVDNHAEPHPEHQNMPRYTYSAPKRVKTDLLGTGAMVSSSGATVGSTQSSKLPRASGSVDSDGAAPTVSRAGSRVSTHVLSTAERLASNHPDCDVDAMSDAAANNSPDDEQRDSIADSAAQSDIELYDLAKRA